MAIENYPSIEYCRQCVREEDGRFFWLERPRSHFPQIADRHWKRWNTKFSGKEAGNLAKVGRWVVAFNRIQIYRHILVWAFHNNEWRTGIDHINRNCTDDRIENLRVANQSQNGGNSSISKRNTSGIKGVCWSKSHNKWHAQIIVNYKHLNLGYFDDKTEAAEAYMDAAKEHWGEFATDGT